jgi:hypothetical protein
MNAVYSQTKDDGLPSTFACTAPGFLDTEQAAIVIVHVFASGPPRHEMAVSGNTQIAAPLLKVSL